MMRETLVAGGTVLKHYGSDIANTYKNAINALDTHLENGRPIIVGVDHTPKRGINDGTIDHWVLVTGRGYDEAKGQYYYTYVETGVNFSNVGVNNNDNRFYYNESQQTLIDNTVKLGSNHQYTVTEVRPNDGNYAGTIVQPSK